jgi:hypothetical protein
MREGTDRNYSEADGGQYYDRHWLLGICAIFGAGVAWRCMIYAVHHAAVFLKQEPRNLVPREIVE